MVYAAAAMLTACECARAGASAIHGDRTQAERNDALTKFSKGEWPLMFATDVAARGLDITGTRSCVPSSLHLAFC
jgi:superfamily II DNA/RNA helicase